MKIAVLGATGNLGSEIVSQALERDVEVVAYVRTPTALEPRPGLTIFGGSVTDVTAMTTAFAGVDAAVSALGGKPPLMQEALPRIATALERAGVPRVVLVSAFGAGDTKSKAGGVARLIYSTAVKGLFEDKAHSEAAVLPGLTMNWTVVHPVNLKKGPQAPCVVTDLSEVSSVPGLPTLPFSSVASAVLDLAADDSAAGKRMLVTTAQGWRA